MARFMRMRSFGSTCVLVSALLAVTTVSAQAYLDPGIASMLVQGLVATIAAVSSALYLVRARIRAMLGRLLGRHWGSTNPSHRSGKNER